MAEVQLKGIDIGKVFPTKSYGDCVVIGYSSSRNVSIKFLGTGYECVVDSGNLRNGLVRDLMYPSVSGVGYMGVGKFVCRKTTIDGMRTPEYASWESMMKRVYSPQDENTRRNYGDCTVIEHWHNYQNFAEWVVTQKGFGKRGMSLDKDLLVKGNKVYSPETCCIIPLHANTALTGEKHTNTSGCAGVEETEIGTFSTKITMNSVLVFLGTFENFEKASFVYKTIKEAYIRSLAEVYKDDIEHKAYQALSSWRVDA